MNRPGARNARPLNLSLRHLRAICDVARFGSFTAAAANLGMTQPAISRLVGQAERELGMEIFQRSTRSVAVTQAGHEFIHSIDRFLEGVDAQVESIRLMGGQLRGRLVISCLLSLTHHLTPDTFKTFRRLHPGVEIQLHEGLGAEVHEDVRSGLADIGFGNVEGLGDDVIAEHKKQEYCVAVLPRDHELVMHSELTLETLTNYPHVSFPLLSGLRRLVDATAAVNSLTFRHILVVEQFGTLFDLVSAGLGVSIVPLSAIPADQRKHLAVRPIVDPPVVRRIGILRLRSRGLTPAAQAFLEIFWPRFDRAEHWTADGEDDGADTLKAGSTKMPKKESEL